MTEENWTEEEEKRMEPIFQNGNTGEHYEEQIGPTIDHWDEFDFLDSADLPDIDPDSYVFEEDAGCEGGACKI